VKKLIIFFLLLIGLSSFVFGTDVILTFNYGETSTFTNQYSYGPVFKTTVPYNITLISVNTTTNSGADRMMLIKTPSTFLYNVSIINHIADFSSLNIILEPNTEYFLGGYTGTKAVSTFQKSRDQTPSFNYTNEHLNVYDDAGFDPTISYRVNDFHADINEIRTANISEPTYTINGTVINQTGSLYPNASIVVVNQDNYSTHTNITTNDNGYWIVNVSLNSNYTIIAYDANDNTIQSDTRSWITSNDNNIILQLNSSYVAPSYLDTNLTLGSNTTSPTPPPSNTTSAYILPTVAYTNSTLFGYCNVSELSGNISYNYKWYKNGTLLSNGSLINNTIHCYQEFVNVSTDCGGLDTGLYDDGAIGIGPFYDPGYGLNLSIDGNWSTYTSYQSNVVSNYIYFNYTVPLNTIGGTWIIKYWPNNLSLNISSCDLENTLALRYKINTDRHLTFGNACISYLECINSSNNWLTLAYNSSGFVGTTDCSKFYEEAILWNILPTLSSDNFKKYDNITFSCQAYNFTDYSSWYNSTNLTISNLPPRMLFVNITPMYPKSNQDLIGYCKAEDLDGDDVTYDFVSWYNDTGRIKSIPGGLYTQNVTVNVDNLSNTLIKSFNNITLECVANDGEDLSNWMNSTPKFIYDNTTCTYIYGNWFINASENCELNIDTNLKGNSVTVSGDGNFTLYNNIYNYSNVEIRGVSSIKRAYVYCYGGCFKDE